MLTRRDLREYQVFFVALIKLCCHHDPKKKLPGLILALEPGAGKTGTVLTALFDLLTEFSIRRVLIVAPLLVAQTVWPEEPDEWEHLAPLKSMMTLLRVEDDDEEVLRAGAEAYETALARYQEEFEDQRQANLLLDLSKGEARSAARKLIGKTPGQMAEAARQKAVETTKYVKLARLADDGAEIHVINKDAMRWLWDHFGRGKRWPYDVLVIDDVREGRSGKTRSKGTVKDGKKTAAPLSRFGIMAAARKHMTATIQLTGTPTPKGLENMWGLAYLIDLGERLGRTRYGKEGFFTTLFHTGRDGFSQKPNEGSFDKIMSKVKDIMFSLDPKNMPELPPYIIDPVKVKLPPDILAQYKKFARDMVLEEHDVEAVNRGVLHGKLLQLANGSVYREDGNDIPIHDCKIEALKMIVERLNGIPLLVAYTYQFDVDRIMKAFPKAVHLRPDNAKQTIRDWNADKIEILLAHRASAGHGLNAQKGIGHMCEYGLTSDAELYLQFLKRIWRPGRKDKVINHVIMAEGTIDEDVFPQYLDPKILAQAQIMDEVKVSFDDDAELDLLA